MPYPEFGIKLLTTCSHLRDTKTPISALAIMSDLHLGTVAVF
jgi:hypothetical protein